MAFDLSVCAEMIWRDRPMAWRCAQLHARGFGVGLWNWSDLDIAALQASGARFSIMNGFVRGNLIDADGAADMLATARTSALVGRRLGVARLNLTGMALGGAVAAQSLAEPSAAQWQRARDTLARICDLADEMDVTFALENLNTAVDHPGVPFARAAQTAALVSELDHPRLRLNLDLYHAQIGEGNLIALCQSCLPWIGEVQVADVPGRHEPGTGEVNWPAIARALKSAGYNGPITMEAWPSGEVDAALDAFRATFAV